MPQTYMVESPSLCFVSVALLVKHSYMQLVSYLDGAIPLQWIWLSALHAIFGGGVPVSTALTHTIVSDVVAERSRVTIFFQLMAVGIAAEFLGSLGSAALMSWNPWIPMILAIFIKVAGIGVLLFIPETLNYNAGEPDAAPTEEATAQPLEWWRCCQNALSHILSSISFLASNRKLLLIISPFTADPLFNQEILRLYISTHYKQTLARATMMISIRSGCILFLNLFILPVLNRHYQKLWGPRQSDLLLARASAAIMSLSLLGLGVAPNRPLLVSALLINSLGWGMLPLVRSLATSLVEHRNVARLNSLIGVFDIVDRIAGSPLMALLFAKGVETGVTWAGLPFIFYSGVVLVLLVGSMHVSV
ncbi:hypothetical protein H633G_10448 [Metarhizium anisopliae BRIP 53284]|nr:hypothetical protein H633G_10448 [Metarhizium anisopliae BRIP 53284]